MKNDLSNVKAGDYIWTIRDGWQKVSGYYRGEQYPIKTGNTSYTLSGRYHQGHYAPSAFTEPPACFNAEPKPCEFEKGDRILVKDYPGDVWRRRYFSHMEKGRYICFSNGADEWSSKGVTRGWKLAIKPCNGDLI